MFFRITKSLSILLILLIIAHISSVTLLTAESYLASKWTALRYSLRDNLAHRWGLEPARHEKPATGPINPPSLQAMASLEAVRQGVNPALVRALITVESNWNPQAQAIVARDLTKPNAQERMKSSAHGLMQIRGSWAGHGPCSTVTSWPELYQPEKNLACGVAILRSNLKTYHGDVFKGLMAYNGGDTCVKNHCPEAGRYALNVMAQLATEVPALVE